VDKKTLGYGALGSLVVVAIVVMVAVGIGYFSTGVRWEGVLVLVVMGFVGLLGSLIIQWITDSKENTFGGGMEAGAMLAFAATTLVLVCALFPAIPAYLSEKFSPYKKEFVAEPPIIEIDENGAINVTDVKNTTTVVQFTFPTDKALSDLEIIPPSKEDAEVRVWRVDTAGNKSYAWLRVGPATTAK
jgi:hypothetical protein